MHKHLHVPPELQHLLEKRESEERRAKQRRSGEERRELDLPSADTVEKPAQRELPAADSCHRNAKRRAETERRQDSRREADQV